MWFPEFLVKTFLLVFIQGLFPDLFIFLAKIPNGFRILTAIFFLLGLELCKADILYNYYSLFWMDENYFLFGPGLKITCRSVAREAHYMDLGVDQLE